MAARNLGIELQIENERNPEDLERRYSLCGAGVEGVGDGG